MIIIVIATAGEEGKDGDPDKTPDRPRPGPPGPLPNNNPGSGQIFMYKDKFANGEPTMRLEVNRDNTTKHAQAIMNVSNS